MTDAGKEYARALFSLACEERITEQTAGELRDISALIQMNPDYMRLLTSAAVAKQERMALLRQAFAGQCSELTLPFLLLLMEQGQFDKLESCIRYFLRCVDETRNIVRVQVYSAVPLTKEETGVLRSRLERMTGRKAKLECRIDSSLLGGLVVELGQQRYDGSLRGLLQRLKETERT